MTSPVYRPISGFLFALTSAFCWGTLPIALKQVLTVMNPQTIVWYRFIFAAIGLFVILLLKKRLPNKAIFLQPGFRWLLILGSIGLAGNFFLFNDSLNYIEPATTQIITQIAPFLMIIIGVGLFKETFHQQQKIGFLVLILGIGLFFNEHFVELFTTLGNYTKGVILCTLAALVWVTYGVSQKVLLKTLSSPQILLFFYIGATLLISLYTQPAQIKNIDSFTGLCLLYCCLNTLVGYGAYGEALNRWEISKVSAIITLVPLITIIFSELAYLISPATFTHPNLNFLAYLGAIIAVSGVLYAIIGHKLSWKCSILNGSKK